jgi:hypothetical protein
MFQQVYASPAKIQQLYETVPVGQLQRKHQGLKEGDELIFQYDGNIVRIRVGERKIFPVEVAHMIVKQSTYIWPVLNGEPLSFCELVDAPNEGASNPFACPAPGCKYQAKDMQGLGRHIIAKHSPREEKVQPQNGAIPTGIAARQPEPANAGDAAE